MHTLTPARDRLTALYAANPDVENADGEEFLKLPKNLIDEIDTLLLAAAQEKVVKEHVARCAACREFGCCVTGLPGGASRCDRTNVDGWDDAHHDGCWVA